MELGYNKADGTYDEAGFEKFVQKSFKSLKKTWAIFNPYEPKTDAELMEMARSNCNFYKHQFRNYSKV